MSKFGARLMAGSGLVAASAIAFGLSTPALATDLSDLQSQLVAMKERLAKLEADRATKRRVAAAAALEAGDKPKTWKLPGTSTSINIGGYTKADFNYTFNGNGSATSYSAQGANIRKTELGSFGIALANLPILFSFNVPDKRFFQFHARQSRFWIKTWTPTDWGELHTHIETDFFGSSNTLRLRHAYGSLGPVLAGQTWNVYNPLFAGPETLDFGGPVGVVSVPRTPQIRYTHNFGQGTVLTVALNTVGDTVPFLFSGIPGLAVNLPSPALGFVNRQTVPDFEWSLHHNFKGGRVWIGGVIGAIEAEFSAGLSLKARKVKWGVGIAGSYRFGRFTIGGQWHVGQGIGGSYMTGSDASAVISVEGLQSSSPRLALKPVFVTGGAAFLQYQISKTLRTNISYGYVYSDIGGAMGVTKGFDPFLSAVGLVTHAHSIFANLIWSPVPQVNFGIEYAHGFTARYNFSNGYWDRIQVSMQYKF